jgi:hypothetical protein
MLLFRPDEKQSPRQLIFELRNGESISTKLIDKLNNQWEEIDMNIERLVRKEYGERLDAERLRRRDVILQLIFEQGRKGNLYTPTQFCQAFENYGGLGGKQTIQARLNVLATKGYIKFNKENSQRIERSKYGVLCVEGMVIPVMQPFLPTHYKESQGGALLPVENPEVWVYLDDIFSQTYGGA